MIPGWELLNTLNLVLTQLRVKDEDRCTPYIISTAMYGYERFLLSSILVQKFLSARNMHMMLHKYILLFKSTISSTMYVPKANGFLLTRTYKKDFFDKTHKVEYSIPCKYLSG